MNLDKCPYCGAKVKHDGSSLHAWIITYECGTTIYGAIDDDNKDNLLIEKECSDSSTDRTEDF